MLIVGDHLLEAKMSDGGKLDLSDVAYITETVHSTFLGSEIKRDDVLLNITGASIGRCAKADIQVIGGNVNQHVCIIRVDGSKFVPVVLVELINSSVGQNQIDSFQAGGNREGLNFCSSKAVEICITSYGCRTNRHCQCAVG